MNDALVPKATQHLYNILLVNDKLAPIERLDALIDKLSIDRIMLETSLLALEAIDIAVADLLAEEVPDSSRSLYLYQDQSLQLLLEQAFQARLDQDHFIKSLMLLNETDLIFRFTAARKFKITDPSAKQLRINSWGKLYIQEKALIKQYDPLYAKLTEQAKSYFIQDEATYQEAVQLLSEPINPLSAAHLTKLNDGLAIKLLS